jgi:TonB family protein
VDAGRQFGTARVRDWRECEGHVLDGTFPLLKYAGRAGASAVFLTEYEGQDAAIKLVAAEPAAAEAQLREWERTSKLSHPHLLSLLRWGSCQLGDITVAYTVSEWADENLAEVLRGRRLTPAEASDLLKQVLDVLAYLHREEHVYGRLKAWNVLAVRDQLKLSGDPVRYGDGGGDDAMQLGALLWKVLTQPGPDGVRTESLPEPFVQIVRRCLQSSDSASTIAEIKSFLERPQVRPRRMHVWRFGAALAGIALAAVVFWNWLRPNPPKPRGQPVAVTTPAAPARPSPAVSPKPVEKSPTADKAPQPEPRRPGVAKQFLPEIPQQAQRTIQGSVRFTVRVQADPSGSVRDAEIVPPATSRYFITFVLQAARKWKFEPSDVNHTWILRFDLFSKDVKVSASLVK